MPLRHSGSHDQADAAGRRRERTQDKNSNASATPANGVELLSIDDPDADNLPAWAESLRSRKEQHENS
jgi:hypothetical protein